MPNQQTTHSLARERRHRPSQIRNPELKSVLSYFGIIEPFDRKQYVLPFHDEDYGTWLRTLQARLTYDHIDPYMLGEAIRDVYRRILKKKKLSRADSNPAKLGMRVHKTTLYRMDLHIRAIPYFGGFAPTLVVGCRDADLARINEARKALKDQKDVYTVEDLVAKYPTHAENEQTRSFWKRVMHKGSIALGGAKPELVDTVASNGHPARGMLKGEADKVFGHWQNHKPPGRRCARLNDPKTGLVHLHPRTAWREYPHIVRGNSEPGAEPSLHLLNAKMHRLCTAIQVALGRPVRRPETVIAGRRNWPAEEDLRTIDAWLVANVTGPLMNERGTFLPLHAIRESGIPEDVWYHYRRVVSVPRERQFVTLKARARLRLIRKWRWCWRQESVDGFRGRLFTVPTAPIGPMLDAKKIASDEGISDLHGRLALQRFLAICGDRGWIHRERENRGWVNPVLPRRAWLYDYGRYRQLLGTSQAEAPTKNAPAGEAVQPQPPAGNPMTRRNFDRDHLWLEWYECQGADTYHSPASIRDRWNRERPDELISKGLGGVDVVKKALQTARNEVHYSEAQ